jgi:hypothetical protein
MFDMLVLGGGRRFLPDDGARRSLRLVDSRVTTKGAILATYETAGAERCGATRWLTRAGCRYRRRHSDLVKTRAIEKRRAPTYGTQSLVDELGDQFRRFRKLFLGGTNPWQIMGLEGPG